MQSPDWNMPELPDSLTLEQLCALAAALGLEVSEADVERLRPEVEALRRAAARLRDLPLEDISLLDDRFTT